MSVQEQKSTALYFSAVVPDRNTDAQLAKILETWCPMSPFAQPVSVPHCSMMTWGGSSQHPDPSACSSQGMP